VIDLGEISFSGLTILGLFRTSISELFGLEVVGVGSFEIDSSGLRLVDASKFVV